MYQNIFRSLQNKKTHLDKLEFFNLSNFGKLSNSKKFYPLEKNNVPKVIM